MTSIYSQLFCGTNPEPTPEQKQELERMEAKEWDRINAMTQEQKDAEFKRIMGR